MSEETRGTGGQSVTITKPINVRWKQCVLDVRTFSELWLRMSDLSVFRAFRTVGAMP